MSKQYLTKEGLEKIKQELQSLETDGRKDVSEKLKKSIAYGDLSENAEYHEAKEDKEMLERKILGLRSLLKQVVIIPDHRSSSQVIVGSVVSVSHQGKQETFKIVGATEVDPIEGKISPDSPLGKAFIDREEGDEIEIETPQGGRLYKILKIE